MLRGDKSVASTREKFEAVLPGLDCYVLERHRMNLTNASSLASGIEKPKKRKELKDGEIAGLQKITQKLKREISTVNGLYKDELSA